MLRRLAAALPLALLLWPPLSAAGGNSGRPVHLLDREGLLFVWRPGGVALEPEPLPWPPVNDLAPIGVGDRLVIVTDNPEAQAGRHRQLEGLAVVLDATGPALEPLRKIPFDGHGLRVTVTEDGHRAFIVSHRSERDPPAGSAEPSPGGTADATGGGRSWIHALDLDAGAVIDSIATARPAAAIAVDPPGRRLFVSLPGRVQSYSTGPLAASWFYRSPGLNLGLAFRHGTDILYTVRGREVALFDPRILAARSDDERRRRNDDASTVLPLQEEAAAILFSEDGLMAVAYGGTGRLTFFDALGRVATGAALPSGSDQPSLVRPILFPSGAGDLLVAVFPSGTIQAIHHLPPPISLSPAALPPPAPVPAATAKPLPEPTPPSTAPTAPTVERASSPAPAGASGDSPALRGRVTGERGAVAAIVLYGPDSIVKERARIAPQPDGRWEVPLPPPGTYRILPVGEKTRPLRSRPLFRTVVVRPGEGQEGVDFEVLPVRAR